MVVVAMYTHGHYLWPSMRQRAIRLKFTYLNIHKFIYLNLHSRLAYLRN